MLTIFITYSKGGVEYESEKMKIIKTIDSSFTEIKIAASVEYIESGDDEGSSAFFLCRNSIKTVSFEENSKFSGSGPKLFSNTKVTSIDLTNCKELLILPKAFCMQATELNNLILPCNLQKIETGSIYSTKLTTLTFPDSLIEILPYGKYWEPIGYNRLLTTVVVSPNSNLKYLNNYAFYGSGLTSFRIPKLVERIATTSFGATNIKEFEIDENNQHFSTDGRTIYNKEGNSIVAISSYKYTNEYVLRENVTRLQEAVFRGVYCTGVVFTNPDITISPRAFWDSRVKSIDLPSGLVEVPESCFSASTLLKTVKINDNLKIIGTSAFAGCESLDTITIPEGVEEIGDYAFNGCKHLAKITIPLSVERIGIGAFAGCASNIVVTFKNTTRFSIVDDMLIFEGSLIDYFGKDNKDVVIPATCKIIGSLLFSKKLINKVTFQEGSELTSIGNKAFSQSTLTSIVLPPTLNSIGNSCFEECNSLSEITIDGTLTVIPESAFSCCKGLTAVTFRCSSILTIDLNAFLFCKKLSTFDFLQLNKLETINENAFKNTSLTVVMLPKSIKTIGTSAFTNIDTLERFSIEVDSPLSEIKVYTLANCKSLSTVELSNNITVLESYSFQNDISLKTFKLSPATHSIKPYTFFSCVNLSSITIPANSSLKKIYGFAFKDTALQEFIVEDVDNFKFKDGFLMNKEETKLIYSLASIAHKSIVIPSNFVEIGEYAFIDAVNIMEVIISDGNLQKIGFHAFEGCTNLRRVVLPSTLKYIDADAFKGCNRIVCGGVVINESAEVMKMAREAGIPDKALSPGCVNNFDKLLVRKSCNNQMRSYINFSHLFCILFSLS